MKKYTFFLIIIVNLCPLLVSASPTLSSQQQAQLNQLDAQQQQRQLEQQHQQQQRLTQSSDVHFNMAAEPSAAFPSQENPCFNIRRIALLDYVNDSSFSPSQFQLELNKTVNQLKLKLPFCLGAQGINVLVKQLQNRLIEKGYVTTKVLVPSQNLAQGELNLLVVTGKIRRIIVADASLSPKFNPWQSWTALTFDSGELLNLRDIEQSLENLKRLPTAEANIEILPSQAQGAEIGDSDIKITYKQAFPWRLNLALDDSGSKATGKWQGSATFSWDNLLLANDLFYTSFSHSIKRSSDDKGKRASQNLQFYYSIPFGYWQLSFSHSENRYHQQVFGAFTDYVYSGESENDKLSLSYVLYRDGQRKTSISAGFWSRQSHNYIDGAEIDVQKRRMSGWEASLNHREYVGKGTLDLSLSYKKGTGARGAISAAEEAYGEGSSRPVIMNASLNYSQPFQLGNQDLRFSTDWSAQWNKTPLIAQDRFNIGGRYTVRGFDGELSLSGERGWLVRNELAWNMAAKNQWLYWGIDAGRVMGWSAKRGLGNHLVGSVLGLRGSFNRFYYDVFIGAPISKPQGFRTSDFTTGFNLGYSF